MAVVIAGGSATLQRVVISCGSRVSIAQHAIVDVLSSSLYSAVTVEAGGQLQLTKVASPDFPMTKTPVSFRVSDDHGGTLSIVAPGGQRYVFRVTPKDDIELNSEAVCAVAPQHRNRGEDQVSRTMLSSLPTHG
eukprot:COSAG01_NODE_3840_length_5646_cov_13.756805_5_plen_134_part_00